MSVVVIATIYPKPEHRDEVIAAFEKAVARVHAEDAGCELYALHTGEDRIVMIEKWTDADALAAHTNSHAFDELGAAIDGRLTGPTDIQTLQPHPAGTAEQGTL